MAAAAASLSSHHNNIFQVDCSCIAHVVFTKKKKKQLKPKCKKAQEAESSEPESFKARVYSVRLNRLLSTRNKTTRRLAKSHFGLKRMSDLAHAICALYDNCLPDIGPSSVYDCICAPKAITICVFKEDDSNKTTTEEDNEQQSSYEDDDCLETVEEAQEQPPSLFKNLYSDNESSSSSSSSSSSEEDDDDEDHSKGLKTFLERNKQSRGRVLKSLVACATLQRVNSFQLPGQDEHVIDLELMSVRRKYRGFRIGKYLLQQIVQNRHYMGAYDVIVTAADSGAVEFYEKYGFSSDAILNSKYGHIGDLWTNTTKMCYVPPYCSLNDEVFHHSSVDCSFPVQALIDESDDQQKQPPLFKEEKKLDLFFKDDDTDDYEFISELSGMEKDIKRWHKIMFSAYQSQAQMFLKLKSEIMTLRAKLSAKKSVIDDYKIQNDILLRKNRLLEAKLRLLETRENDEKDLVVDVAKTDNDDMDSLLADLKTILKNSAAQRSQDN